MFCSLGASNRTSSRPCARHCRRPAGGISGSACVHQGKAERFIQSALREWAYGFTYQNLNERTAALEHWNHHYNWQRPTKEIGGAAGRNVGQHERQKEWPDSVTLQ